MVRAEKLAVSGCQNCQAISAGDLRRELGGHSASFRERTEGLVKHDAELKGCLAFVEECPARFLAAYIGKKGWRQKEEPWVGVVCPARPRKWLSVSACRP